ncbi:phage portal protein [Tessaracoccus palaemonis]|uniref:Phage portal protein n=1 Tax=Tessaracoccus palaemonis TaxID=2829499 RepID=A0ABX8SH88_9ACTN|nr:phage portal protein [Tessaracoccus palaemonis]QXT62746.1 phage portal protein [Tessaracoccus palaemonis]
MHDHLIGAIVTEWRHRLPGYTEQRNYCDGNHQLRFATPDFEAKYGSQVRALRENLCEGVVSAFTDRLAIASWGDKAAAKIDDAEGLERLLGYVHDEAFRCGDGYVLVWPGPDGQPTPHYHRADQIVPHVDPANPAVLDWAAKIWVDTNHYGRINIYDRHQVERYRTLGRLPEDHHASDLPENPTAWIPMDLDGEGDVIRHTFGATPALWWKQGADTADGHGKSILTNVIPLQDANNKSVANLVVTEEAYARPFRYLLNFKPASDNPFVAAGEYMTAMAKAANSTVKRRFDPSRQQIFTHDGPGPFGQLDPADLQQLVKVQDAWAVKIARVVGIPPYYLTQTSGDVPSGQSLRVLTSRLTARVRRFQRDSAPVLRGLAQLLGIPEPDITWAPPMDLDPLEKWQVAQIRQSLGLALEDVLTDTGTADIEGVVERATAATSQRLGDMGKALRDGQIGF